MCINKQQSIIMKNLALLIGVLICLSSCKGDKKQQESINPTEVNIEKVFDDSDYVLDANYQKGDVRRYGIFPDSSHNSGHPFTKKTRIETVLDLCENHNIELNFPKGYYNFPLVIRGRKNIKANFNDSEFGGMIQIIEKDTIHSKNITFKGNIITYGGLFTRRVNNINIDKVVVKSNRDKSIYGIKSKGCHIYAESKNITIGELIVEDLGSESDKFKYVQSALMINGSDTQNVKIDKIHIQASDRNGLYISGKDHLIGDVIVDKFGMGSFKDMVGIEGVVAGKEKEFKALWVNKCYDSFIESIIINEKESKGQYTAHFDSGDNQRPFTIGKFKVVNDNPKINILEEESNNVVIEIKE